MISITPSMMSMTPIIPMTFVVFVVRSRQITFLYVTKPEHPFEDAAESKLKRRERRKVVNAAVTHCRQISNRQDENLRRQRDGASVEHEPDRPPEPDDQLVDEVPRGEGEWVPVALQGGPTEFYSGN